jgi:hypothetical protein
MEELGVMIAVLETIAVASGEDDGIPDRGT